MTEARWPSSWVRAALELALLGSVEQAPQHGYALAQTLADAGFGLLKGGSLYPALSRLEDSGFVCTRWVEGDSGPGRREYQITNQGRVELARQRQAWAELSHALRHPEECS